ncbi:MAG: DUF4242 domain-containing protein, partial [Dehalococcoidia bacterium]|nr:DUF4242 domain-containing protein [Dehalococcoidia bacterium]
MPKFMDAHADLKLPPEMVEQLRKEATEKQADRFGVTQLELYYNQDGLVYCLLDAPNEQAVRDHHQEVGVACGDVHQVDSLL